MRGGRRHGRGPVIGTITDTALRKALAKKYNLDIFMHTFEPTGYIDSGLPTLNRILSTPGYALGRLTVVRGDFATGKSSLAHLAIAQCQQAGGTAVLFETEDALDLPRMREMGVDPDALVIFQPEHVEECLAIHADVINLVRDEQADNPVLIVWDSIAATPTKLELENDAGKSTMGGHSRLISQGLRQLTRLIGRQRVALLWVNQTRIKQTQMAFQDSTTMIAEKPLTFHASHMLKVSRTGTVGGARAESTGIKMQVEVEKCKFGAPWRKTEVRLDFDARAFRADLSWLDLAVDLGVVSKAGAWHTYGNEKFQADGFAEVLARTDVSAAVEQALHPEVAATVA